MQKYFYSDGEENFGPFTLEELKSQGINQDTKVWSEEMVDWKPAGSVDELKDLFTLNPPNLPSSSSQSQYYDELDMPSMPPNHMVLAIIVTVACCMPFGIAGIVNASKVETLYRQGDYEGSKRASDNAKKWSIYAIVFGLIATVLAVLVNILALVG